VLDSNIFFSALMSTSGPPFIAVQAWVNGSFYLITSQQQMRELQRASRYGKFRNRFVPHHVGELIKAMKPCVFEGRIPSKHQCSDPEDSYLLDLADASGADYLDTGDH
jgi:putative PIN family toxin of toxin-antitoxin system